MTHGYAKPVASPHPAEPLAAGPPHWSGLVGVPGARIQPINRLGFRFFLVVAA